MSKNPAEPTRHTGHPRRPDDVDIQGVHWPGYVTEEALNAIKRFDVRDDDVWITTWPKSGTHWVAEICHLILNDGHLDKVDRAQVPMPLEFDVEPSENRLARYKAAPTWKSPRVLVTHVPVKFLPDQILTGKKGKVITVIRNPKDVLVSLHHFLNTMEPTSTFEEQLQKNVYSEKAYITSWFEHVPEYWTQRHKKGHLVLKYEDMKTDTRGTVIQVADHLERPLTDEVIDSITDLVSVQSMKARFNVMGEIQPPRGEGTTSTGTVGAQHLMRKGIVGDWKNTFTVAQSEAFDTFYRQKMAGLGLKLEFE